MRDRPVLDLFLISWLILFLELACIRWFPSHVLFLTFFTNTVLLACFVGMSIGCLVARAKTRHLLHTPLWLAAAVAAGMMTDQFAGKLQHVLAVGDQADPEVVFFGTETSAVRQLHKPDGLIVPIEVFGGAFFALIAASLVGPGQEMGRAFNRVPSRTAAYSVNLLGSLAGIGSFAACSYLHLPPVVWFGVSAAGLAYFLLRPDPDAPPGAPQPRLLVPLTALAVVAIIPVFTSGFNLRGDPAARRTYWSPYYRIDYDPGTGLIGTNRIAHQVIFSTAVPTHAGYALPYLFRRDVAGTDGQPVWPPFKRVLIIGAGSGNDVARALQWCPPDARIDAVEIDPAIQAVGAADHPDRPYQDPRVRVHLNDGRNFLRTAPDAEYDLVIFALVDSLVLHSGYSNLRLESFLFTRESFRDVRRVLKPTGLAAVYNFFRHGWLVARIREALLAEFGADPVVLAVPAREDGGIGLGDFVPQGFTAFFAGSAEVLDPLKAAFRSSYDGAYWLAIRHPVSPDPAKTPSGFRPDRPPPLPPAPAGRHTEHLIDLPDWGRLQMAKVEDSQGTLKPATDDWPFLYTREPAVPGITLRGIALTVLVSLGLWLAFRPEGGLGGQSPPTALGGLPDRPEWGAMARSFFLGAGFMLVETKAVVHMALLFGGTWMVNTVVIAAVLVMALAGNLYAGWVKPKRLEPYYVGLFAAIGLGLAVSMNSFLGLDPTAQVLGACALVFAPIAFAGVIFATTFRRCQQPDRVFGANVAGALVGGLAENTSVVLGFQYLLCVAAGFYLLSAAFGNRRLPTPSAGKDV
jgi:SAM-dependent methyltransferase